MIIDSQFILTGSFNFSKVAEEANAGIVLIIQDVDLASRSLATAGFTKHIPTRVLSNPHPTSSHVTPDEVAIQERAVPKRTGPTLSDIVGKKGERECGVQVLR
jgi:phosphatidylserine/phosphatidylglycerophosphate/cardiolipin synthase-like enzyme